jgi:hypothetical protein
MMKTVGLNDKDTRLYFVNKAIVIIDDPELEVPVAVKRDPGTPTEEDWKEINKALALCSMELCGEQRWRRDGLWSHPVKEARNGQEVSVNQKVG